MKSIRLTFLSFIISFNVTAKETIYWVQYDIPPFYIKDGSYSGKGVADITDAMIRKQLPQYEHVIIWANIARIKHMMEQGKNVVCGNMIKTPEREAYQIFSDYHRKMSTSLHVITSSQSEGDNDGSTVNLLSLIASKDKYGYFIASRSYGSKFDKAIGQKDNKRVNYSLNAPMGNVLDLILKDKNGFAVGYPEEVTYHVEKKYGHSSSIGSTLDKKSLLSKYRISPILDQPEYIFTYVVAPKTSWGYQVMKDINDVLLRLQSNSKFMDENNVWKNKINNR
jgi:uncharacterized protein (TIGR02285 family)